MNIEVLQKLHRVACWSAAISAMAMLPGPLAAADGAWPSDVSARYKLSFNGFEVGSYNFQSRLEGKAYAASGSAEISALFGAFKWKGTIESHGSLEAHGPQPQSYQMAYKAKKKAASISLGFDKSGVNSVTLVPNKPPNPEAVAGHPA